MSELKEDEEIEEYKLPWYSWLAFPGILIILGITGGCLYWFVKDHGNRGLFGDMFGVTNALFSGLAFVGLLFTLLMQRNELKMQRKELRYQREELKLQREEMKLTRSVLSKQEEQLEAQSQTMQKQTFEDTFF